jgi:hypothetical protein
MDDEIIIGVIDDVIIKGFAVQAGGPTTNIRLFLKAASLPKSTMTQQQPDVLARVSLKEMIDETEVRCLSENDVLAFDDIFSTCSRALTRLANEKHARLRRRRQVVRKCSNPSWTTSFAARYEYGTQLLFFVDLFVVSAAGHVNAVASAGVGNADHARGMKLLGRAAFDVQDVLGSANKVMARRLPRNAGM